VRGERGKGVTKSGWMQANFCASNVVHKVNILKPLFYLEYQKIDFAYSIASVAYSFQEFSARIHQKIDY
jgi:hypothetical protein